MEPARGQRVIRISQRVVGALEKGLSEIGLSLPEAG